MATSYRKLQPLDPRNILVFDKVPADKLRPPIERLPQQDKLPRLAAPTRLYDIREIAEQLGKLGKLTPKDISPGETFTLSARQPYVENRGVLESFNNLLFTAEVPNIQFINTVGPSDESRFVNLWLHGLTPGHSYIAQVRVQAGGDGTFQVSSGEGGRQTAAGGDRTIAVLLHQVQRDLSLVRVECRGAWYWAFADATITALGPV